MSLIDSEQIELAADLAESSRIVTPLTSAVVLASANTGEQTELTADQAMPERELIDLAGQDKQAPMVAGTKTASKVHFRTQTNYEAILNLAANTVQIIGLLFAGVFLLLGVTGAGGRLTGMSAGLRIALGLVIGEASLILPGSISWLLASCRDANLLS